MVGIAKDISQKHLAGIDRLAPVLGHGRRNEAGDIAFGERFPAALRSVFYLSYATGDIAGSAAGGKRNLRFAPLDRATSVMVQAVDARVVPGFAGSTKSTR